MAYDKHVNFAKTLVASEPFPATTGISLAVVDASGFPPTPFNVVVCPLTSLPTTHNAEILRVTNTIGNTFVLQRVQESTTARAITVGDAVILTTTAKSIQDLENAINSFTFTTGTWTPIIGSTGGHSGQTYSVQSGIYTVLADIVFASFIAILTNKGPDLAGGSVRVEGLPFPVKNDGILQYACGAGFNNLNGATLYTVSIFAPVAGFSFANIYGTTAASTSNLGVFTGPDITNTTSLQGTLIYKKA